MVAGSDEGTAASPDKKEATKNRRAVVALVTLGRSIETRVLARERAHNSNNRIATRALICVKAAQWSIGTNLGFLVPGVVTTPIGAFSSPTSIAIRMRAQNASSISK
jgi:hypothetical protein